jgi:hypothetical protein
VSDRLLVHGHRDVLHALPLYFDLVPALCYTPLYEMAVDELAETMLAWYLPDRFTLKREQSHSHAITITRIVHSDP